MKLFTTWKQNIKELLDWEQYPENVFLIGVPLVIIVVGLLIIEAVLQLLAGDPGYLIIILVFLPVGIALYLSCWKSIKALRLLQNRH